MQSIRVKTDGAMQATLQPDFEFNCSLDGREAEKEKKWWRKIASRGFSGNDVNWLSCQQSRWEVSEENRHFKVNSFQFIYTKTHKKLRTIEATFKKAMKLFVN